MNNEILCYCYKVKRYEVIKFLEKNNYNINDLLNNLKIGTECGACNADIEDLLSKLLQEKSTLNFKGNKSNKKYYFKNFINSFMPNIFKYYLESGFYVQNKIISTHLITGNWGINFSKNIKLVSYDCVLKIYGNDGKIYCKRKMRLKEFDSLKIDFSSLGDIPDQGWFLFYLKPRDKGLEGSIRPQILFKGNKFATSYHPQPHWVACNEKSIIDYLFKGKNRSKLSIINASNKINKISIYVKNIMETSEKSELLDSFNMDPLNSKIYDFSEYINDSNPLYPKLLTVKSTSPTRKHIINIQNNGSWNIDHFPNAK